MIVEMLTPETTDSHLDRLGNYTEHLNLLQSSDSDTEIMASSDSAPANKLLAKIKDEQVSRHPSPQPTHFSVDLGSEKVNGQNGHKVLRSATVGYIAPEFKGKEAQMATGKSGMLPYLIRSVVVLIDCSEGDHRKGWLDSHFTSR